MIFPHTSSRRVVLRPATDADRANFFRAALRSGVGTSRQSAKPTAVARRPYAAFIVRRRDSDEELGFSSLYDLDQAGHIRSGVYLDPKRARFGIGAEALHLSVNYAFATCDVDKVITQTTEASFAAFGLDQTRRRAVFNEHVYFRGQFWNLYSFEIDRRMWESHVDRDPTGVLPDAMGWRTAPGKPLAGP